MKMRGKWLDVSLPENYTFQFINLATRVREALTDNEFKLLSFYQRVVGLSIQEHTNVVAKVPFSPKKTVLKDKKLECISCHEFRSMTLMKRDKKCGLCFFDAGKTTPETLPNNRSYWYECRTCTGLYAIVRTDQLNVDPKCHYCREEKTPPLVKCVMCRNKFVIPAKTTDEFVCPHCEDDEPRIDEKTLTMRSFFKEHSREILNMFGINAPDKHNPFDRVSLFKQKDTIAEMPTIEDKLNILLEGKEVLNLEEIINKLKEWVMSGKSESSDCMMCFETMHNSKLLSPC